MNEITCKLLVIGGGPGGYVCAIRAGQLGLDTVIVESEKLGGTCLNIGCIPSKALIHAADEFDKVMKMTRGHGHCGITVQSPSLDLTRTMEWKDSIVAKLNGGVGSLLQKARVKTIRGHARFIDGKTVEVATETGNQIVRADNVVIATGSEPVSLANLPFGGAVLSSADALSLRERPEQLAVIGGGYIGLELGTAFAKLGSKVTIVEGSQQILPQYDGDLVKPVMKRLSELGVKVLTEALAEGLDTDGKGVIVKQRNGERQTLAADRVLVTVGRRPRVEGFGLEELDLDRSGPFIRIDDQCRSSMRGVYAIGDVTGDPMLAHRAMAQGEMVAELVAGHRRNWDKRCIPAVCFTDPEIVSAGMLPAEARVEVENLKIGTFPFAANGRAMTTTSEKGFVRVVARADNHLVLGLQAVGAGVSELGSAFALAIEMGARLEDLAGTVHPHPTLSEALQEAALQALGHALHI
ncbi:dihydrolipoyl dehydrogenase (plasmid) [Peteryoungia desertarenae]|uniref:Dihydrolipoyl dehydrogenase n=1 Tax=Peteryoungia desertarenae TaxID=1813451 RepID=A0ABX6QTQ5_9HYPH|nr:dihydrolipoyl dehydrogenase [Peteryoungia desertarenae]QLF72041.1 dihydrolipoyl dehydrogenase [Peteryoungia desertarenae]